MDAGLFHVLKKADLLRFRHNLLDGGIITTTDLFEIKPEHLALLFESEAIVHKVWKRIMKQCPKWHCNKYRANNFYKLELFLEHLGADDYIHGFHVESIELDDLYHLSTAQLEKLVPEVGPRMRIIRAIGTKDGEDDEYKDYNKQKRKKSSSGSLSENASKHSRHEERHKDHYGNGCWRHEWSDNEYDWENWGENGDQQIDWGSPNRNEFEKDWTDEIQDMDVGDGRGGYWDDWEAGEENFNLNQDDEEGEGGEDTHVSDAYQAEDEIGENEGELHLHFRTSPGDTGEGREGETWDAASAETWLPW